MKSNGGIFVPTGVGISADSGIPVIQGTSWRGHSHYELANIEAWERDPQLVWRYYSDRRASARSILAVMMLAASMGSVVRLEARGPDEAAAMTAMVKLIDDGFGEMQ